MGRNSLKEKTKLEALLKLVQQKLKSKKEDEFYFIYWHGKEEQLRTKLFDLQFEEMDIECDTIEG